ncbi:uncharacterized protein LOC130923923 [Corythoichthys intestinalis]|uniref:uncharacterized protein LOC130923923 n=1 Tax=Corythoichthys intestinalis TaxID=161448 RepID=UPI0025A4F680|nr:uncharacterized protein LOC130923923 [Corythoichthys intestinalis]
MDSVRSTFHTQLAAVMDSLLAAAVCEIAKIFESSMCEQQAEISSLLAKLEQVERKQRTKTERDGTSAEGGNTMKSKPMTEAGKEPNGENTSSEQKEVTDSLTSIKHEQSPCEGSQLPLASFVVKVPDESIDIPDQRTRLPTDTHVYVKVCQRDEVTQVEDHQSQQERASPPFLTITQSGRCPPRHDPSQAQPSQWPLVLDNTQACSDGKLNDSGSFYSLRPSITTGWQH